MKEKRLITLHGTTMFIKFCQSFRKPLDLFFSHWYLKPRSDDEAAKSSVLRSIRSDRPKPLGQLITFTHYSLLPLQYPYMKFLSFLIFLLKKSSWKCKSVQFLMKKKIQNSESKNHTWSAVNAVHHLYHYATEDLLASIGLIWSLVI